MSKKFFALILIVLAALSFSLVAMAQDEEEEGGDTLQLTLLHDGDSVEGLLTEDVTAVMYAFNANEGDEVTIELTAVDEFDPFLVLLGPAGEFIAFDDDSAGDLNSLIEEFELPETGTYFVIASTYTDISTFGEASISDDTAFELSVEGISEVEDMGDGFLFFAAELLDGEPLLAEISEDQAAWYFVFVAEEGDVVSISANSDNFDTIVHVFGPLGDRVAVNDDVDREGGDYNSFVEEAEVPADGVYLVVVTNPFIFQAGLDDADETYFGEFEVELTFE